MTDTTKTLVNKVAQKALITLDLEQYFVRDEDMAFIDLKGFLFKGLILREADFRETVKTTDWSQYKNKYVAIYCTTDAIIPMWAYMVLSAEVSAYAADVVCANPQQASDAFLLHKLSQLDMEQFKGQRVVIKGCGDTPIPDAAYVIITHHLRPVAKSIMYGEPCSTVPIYKKAKEA